MNALSTDPAAEEMMRRRYGPAQPRLEAGMAAVVIACAIPPLAHALLAESKASGEPAVPDRRIIPMWTSAVTGTADLRATWRRQHAALIPFRAAAYPPGAADPVRYGAGYADDDPVWTRAVHVLLTAVMMDAHQCYMGLLTEAGRDAYTRHCAVTAGAAFGATSIPVTAGALCEDYAALTAGGLQATAAGAQVLSGVLAAESVGGWPGELLAARSRHLIPQFVTDELGVPLPDLYGVLGADTAQEYAREHAARCPWC